MIVGTQVGITKSWRMAESRTYPPYTGRHERTLGITDGELWSRRNYKIDDGTALVNARRPYFIEVRSPAVGGQHQTCEVLPIFLPAGAHYVRERVLFAVNPQGVPRSGDHVEAARVAVYLDYLAEWPSTDPVSKHDPGMKALYELRAQCEGNLGYGVLTLLTWHGVLTPVSPTRRLQTMRLDREALDFWCATACLLAAEH